MAVVAVINQKGGVGKTSIATNLASALAQNQHTVLLDSDPQRSAAGWATLNPRPDLLLTVQGVDAGMLGRDAKASDEQYDWTIIDCPPGINRVNVDAIRAADVVLIPCKPRVWDVWACGDIVEAVKRRQQANRGWPKAAFRDQHGTASHPFQPEHRGCPEGPGPAAPPGPNHRKRGLRPGGL